MIYKQKNKNNIMAFSKQLEEVIDAALADGVITEKERSVIRKKALLEGADPDEVDVVIDGRLQQMQKAIDDAKQKVRKCPSCGEIIPAMSAVCPSCGQVIDTSNADNKALAVYMEKLESSLVQLKENGASKYNNKVKAELEGMIRQGRAMYGENKKIAFLISEVEASIAKFDKAHKNQLIMKFAGIAVVVLILCGWFVKSSMDSSTAAKQAEAQYVELCSKIDELESPNISNYKDVESKFLKITWKDIPGDNTNYKKDYLEKKRGFASQIGAVVVHPEEGSIAGKYDNNEAPDQIAYPDMYINN